MSRRFLVFVVTLLALTLVIAFVFLGSGATKNTGVVRGEGIPATTR